jgi:signal transduction histidine kinase
MGALVGDLLLLAREDANAPVRRVPIYLDDLAQRAITRARALGEADGRPIRLGAWDEAPALGDPDLIERAILALLHNALVHADAGPVTVETGSDAESSWLRVTDTGPGIAPADRDRIFERGTRLDASRPGTGLGLSIVRFIAEGLGGTVAVSDDQGGTSFLLSLPTLAVGSPPTPAPRSAG